MALRGIPIKHVSLIFLVLQNSALALTMRYSRVTPGPPYLTSTAVILSETLKCIVSVCVHICHQRQLFPRSISLPLTSRDHYSFWSATRIWTSERCREIFGPGTGFTKLLVPALLYAAQNNLQFVAASNLDAATFQVTYQCKLLTTALFAVFLLRQRLSIKKWSSLLILTIGIACVQLPSSRPSAAKRADHYVTGLIAVAISCICSGFAGVYFEKILKGHSTTIWVRNIQLSTGCLGAAVVGAYMWDGDAIRRHGFFQGYNVVVIATIVIQAAGGLIVAMVIKHADNILKGFATSLSIILSTVVSVYMFDFVITPFFLIGCALAVCATFLYSGPDREKFHVSDHEKAQVIIVNGYQQDAGANNPDKNYHARDSQPYKIRRKRSMNTVDQSIK